MGVLEHGGLECTHMTLLLHMGAYIYSRELGLNIEPLICHICTLFEPQFLNCGMRMG